MARVKTSALPVQEELTEDTYVVATKGMAAGDTTKIPASLFGGGGNLGVIAIAGLSLETGTAFVNTEDYNPEELVFSVVGNEVRVAHPNGDKLWGWAQGSINSTSTGDIATVGANGNGLTVEGTFAFGTQISVNLFVIKQPS